MRLHLPPSLRYRKFAIMWVGMLFAWMGQGILVWAIPWHMRTFTRNALLFGGIGLFRLLPVLVFSLFAGVLADRFSRRLVIFLTQGFISLIGICMAWLTFTGSVQVWILYLMLGLHSTAFVLSLPARLAITPNLVPQEDLPNALSVEAVALQVGGLLGPLVNGWVIDHWGLAATYLVAGLSLFLLPLAVLLIGHIPQQRLALNRKGVDWQAIGEGIRFTFQHPLIFPSMLLDFLATTLSRADSFLAIFAYDILRVDASGYGWLTAAPSLGATTAGLLFSQLRRMPRQGRVLLVSVSMIGGFAVVFGLSRNFGLSLLAMMGMGFGDGLSTIIRSAIRQVHTPDQMRGRMTSVNQIFFMGGPYLGDVKSGYLGNLIGVPMTLVVGGLACMLSVLWVGLRWQALRTYDGVV